MGESPVGVECIAISPDGQLVASGGRGNILVREMKEGGQIKHSLDGDIVDSLCFSPNGEKLASSSSNAYNEIRVFEVESGKLILRPMGYIWTHSVIWSLDGTRLFSAHALSSEIRCWNSENGELIGEPWTGHTGAVFSLSLSPDGMKIASASDDRSVRFWDAQSGDPIVSRYRINPGYQRSLSPPLLYDSLLDLPAVPAPKGLLTIHAQDEFDFRDLPTGRNSQPLVRPAPMQGLAVRLAQNPYHPKAREWHTALMKKRKAVLELLEAQTVIERVQAEAGKHLETDTIALIRSKFYPIEDETTPARRFISAVSNIGLNLPACASAHG
ncbi:quinon protein alcohol dehydrogenase-like superfamily [Melanogaster broomeanus]|nr:quinon protein alcohol dehydrogenase-like superfamily [Melanogaster broomeanus]